MKTKELIRLLQEADPTGEEEVCVNNEDILDVGTEPAYWDGTLQILERDEKLSPYYNVVGATFKREGCKVSIFTHGIRSIGALDKGNHPRRPCPCPHGAAPPSHHDRRTATTVRCPR